MSLKRNVFGLAVLAAIVVPGCKVRLLDTRDDPPPAPAPPPLAAPAAPPPAPAPPPPPPVAPRPAPVVPTPAPVKTVFLASAPTVDPIAVCRTRFTSECTRTCNAKIDERVAPSKRRIGHDICFAECTRAAHKRC